LGFNARRNFVALRAEMLALDVQFGQLGGEGLFQKLDEAGMLDHHIPEVSEDTIAQAVRTPPEGSRATLRGRIVSQPEAARRYTVNWDHVADMQGRVLDMSDPFAVEENWSPATPAEILSRVQTSAAMRIRMTRAAGTRDTG
jgi:hypothetical protein